MAKKAKHSEGASKGKFCAKRSKSCCGSGETGSDGKEKKNDYRVVCKTEDGKSKFEKYKFKGKKEKPVDLEAHHLLCVASVVEHLIGGKWEENGTTTIGETPIDQIIKETEWCVNNKDNMIAMPLWGHTVKYYCDVITQDLAIVDRITGEKVTQPPPFANIPQHNYDHTSKKGYQKKYVNPSLINLAQRIESKKDNHEVAVADLLKALEHLQKQFRKMLTILGNQKGGKYAKASGTHSAWINAHKEPRGTWYYPFSMTVAKCADRRTFPVSGSMNRKAKKIVALAKAAVEWAAM